MSLTPQITDAGLLVPDYNECLAYWQDVMRSIYGSDINLDPDSQDNQFLAALAQGYSDLYQLAAAVFRSFSPTYAQGSNLSSLVKINGLRRLIATNSQQNVNIGGTVGTTIANGVVSDANSVQWNLPASVVIPNTGTITVTAVCAEKGSITAVGPLTIATPTRGWSSAALTGDTVLGQPVEKDSTLRRRQSVSTALPAQTPLAAITANVANVNGVIRLKPYENDTSAADANGVPAHTICMVVEGGDAQAIAQAIFDKKAPGVGTYGTTTETVIDSVGVPHTIDFFNLDVKTLSMLVNVSALTGYVSTTGDSIVASLVQFLNGLAIGESSYLSRLFSPANLTGDAATEATGLDQLVLDTLSSTYNISSLYQALDDMTVTGGPYAAGATDINVTNGTNFHIGDKVGVTMDNTLIHYTTLSNVVGTTLTLAAGIPVGRTVNNGALVYVSGDVSVGFNQAAGSATANITLTAS